MGTLGEMKARIILETNRADLGAGEEAEDLLTNGITRAIEFYQDEDFWFKHTSASANTAANVATVAIPAALRVVRSVAYLGCQLGKVPLEQIEASTETGTPIHWAEAGANIRVGPIPAGIYALSFYGVANTDAPTLDADAGIWMNEAQDLIASRVLAYLQKVFKNYDAAGVAAKDEEQYLSGIRAETRRRRVTPLRSMPDTPWYSPNSLDAVQEYF